MSVHGNPAERLRTAYLYRLSQTNGEYLKTGISQNPMTRFPQNYMLDKEISIATEGARRQMLSLERFIVERDPGPLNRERFAGDNAGDSRGDERCQQVKP